MSTDEQDLILGRLMRQIKESRQSVAALETKLSEYYHALEQAGLILNGTWNPKPKPAATFDEAVTAVRRLPNPEDIVQSLNDLRSERQRLTGLEGQLERMS